jgi:hypothetical protein
MVLVAMGPLFPNSMVSPAGAAANETLANGFTDEDLDDFGVLTLEATDAFAKEFELALIGLLFTEDPDATPNGVGISLEDLPLGMVWFLQEIFLFLLACTILSDLCWIWIASLNIFRVAM